MSDQHHRFEPQWTRQPPGPGTFRSIFKWGAPNRFKHPSPRLFRLLKKRLAMSDADFLQQHPRGDRPVTSTTPKKLAGEQIAALEKIVGPDNIAADDYARVKYSTGKTMAEILKLRQGIADGLSDLIVHPRSKADVREIIVYCSRQKIPVQVYGGGSSVTFGLQSANGGVTLVMSTHMHRILTFSETNRTITVEPGIMGPDYEHQLRQAPEKFSARHRYTGGHFPQSFEHSTVGGWIAAAGSGQQSSYYGDMYDLVVSQEYVTPTGTLKTLAYPGTATGPKVNDFFKGSEGAFGVLVSATLKIFRYMPENRRPFAFIFPDWAAAATAARQISQGEFGMPSVFRISDPEETDMALTLYGVDGTPIDRIVRLRGFRPAQRCLFLGQADGHKDLTAGIRKNVRRICRRNGAISLTGYPVTRWAKGRYTDPYLREDLNDFGIMIDTLETGVLWDNFHRLHRGVVDYIQSRPHTIGMAHASHFYPQGTNLYFIFIARMSDIETYTAFQENIIDRIVSFGGSLSHHHGIGKLLAPWMEAHLGKAQMDALRALKAHFDPGNIMNPGGTLGLDLPDGQKRGHTSTRRTAPGRKRTP